MAARQSTITIAAALFLTTLAGSLFAVRDTLDKALEDEGRAYERRTELRQLGINLADASDYLTDEARKLAVTGNLEHLDNYWREINVTDTRGHVLERLRELGTPEEEFALLALAKQNSDALVATETRSMRLVIEATGNQDRMPSAVAAWELSTDDRALSNEAKMAVAQEIMFDAKYAADKKIIMDPIAEFQEMMNNRAEQELLAARSEATTMGAVENWFFLAVIAGFAAVLAFFYRYLAVPVKGYASALVARDRDDRGFALTPQGTTELRDLADAFNHQLHKNQKMVDELGEMTRDLEKSREELQRSTEAQLRMQEEVIRDLAAPTLEIGEGTLLLPLVGTIDTTRAQQLTESLLTGIVEHSAAVAILDVAGVPTIDTSVARHIIQAVDAARILGTEGSCHWLQAQRRPDAYGTRRGLGARSGREGTFAPALPRQCTSSAVRRSPDDSPGVKLPCTWPPVGGDPAGG